jgi:hypothetical protein
MMRAVAEQGEGAKGGAEGQSPSEEELRAQLEEEIRKVRVEDVLLQSIVSVLNLSGRRIAKEDERDLAQAKLGIDAARAVADLLPEQARPQIRQAISELQLLYAKYAEGGEPEPQPEPGPEAGEVGAEGETGRPPDQGKRDSGLWTPPGA